MRWRQKVENRRRRFITLSTNARLDLLFFLGWCTTGQGQLHRQVPVFLFEARPPRLVVHLLWQVEVEKVIWGSFHFHTPAQVSTMPTTSAPLPNEQPECKITFSLIWERSGPYHGPTSTITSWMSVTPGNRTTNCRLTPSWSVCVQHRAARQHPHHAVLNRATHTHTSSRIDRLPRTLSNSSKSGPPPVYATPPLGYASLESSDCDADCAAVW